MIVFYNVCTLANVIVDFISKLENMPWKSSVKTIKEDKIIYSKEVGNTYLWRSNICMASCFVS